MGIEGVCVLATYQDSDALMNANKRNVQDSYNLLIMFPIVPDA